jgi:hypothetical protein
MKMLRHTQASLPRKREPITSVIMGPGSRSLRSLGRDDRRKGDHNEY